MIKADQPEGGARWLAVRLRDRARLLPGVRLRRGVVARAAGARRWAFDAALAAAVTAAEIGGSYAATSWHQKHVAPGILAYLILATGGTSLLARRRYPVAVLAITLAPALLAAHPGAGLAWFALILPFVTAAPATDREAACRAVPPRDAPTV